MTAIRVVIADDEPLARRGIRQLLASHQDIEIAGEARNGREAVRILKALSPDLVFLDVQMPELDGFAVLRAVGAVREPPLHLPLVIFITAYETFAVRAFEEQAVDYLVKPVREERLHEALARARERLRTRQLAAQELDPRRPSEGGPGAPTLVPSRPSEGGPPSLRRLVIATSGSDLIVDAGEIEWIEADDYYAAIHALGRRHLIRESLASLEGRLDRTRFVRVHRSAIVNLAQVREVRTKSTGESAVVLRNGIELPLSRRRRERVSEAIRLFSR